MQRNADLKAGGAAKNDTRLLDFISSHPATPDRVKNAILNARQFSGPGTKGERDRVEYLAALEGMVYGEDPSEGFVRGRRFVHPKLGFTFTAPAGFTLDNTAEAVLGLKDGGGQALRLDVVSVPPEQTLGAYLTSGWMENVDKGSVQESAINGFPAATALANGEGWSFRLYVIRYGSDVYRFIFAARERTAQADRSFREAVSTFRRMSLREAAQVKPTRVAVVTVGARDTVDSLAKRMAVPDHALETFRVLNGLTREDKLKPGERVKIVVE
jgi:predicted Zn-dependent protease